MARRATLSSPDVFASRSRAKFGEHGRQKVDCGPTNNLWHQLKRFPLLNMADTLHNAPIVLDNGSGTIRAGFAGDDLPKCYFPSFVGRPKHTRVLAGALEGDVFIGRRAEELRGLLKIRYPLEHGIVTDWDDMEKIWHYVYSEELKTMSEEVCTRSLGMPMLFLLD